MPGSTTSSSAREGGPHRLWVTILAGGIGSRFWPLSTERRPKQLLALGGPRPLVADAVARARTLAPTERIRILAEERLIPGLREAVPGLPRGACLAEPRARGTAPVLVWAAHTLLNRDPDAVLVSLHADHFIAPTETFAEVVRDAAEVAVREDVLVTVGARPERPETGYGYIRPGARLAASSGASAFRVDSFHEKPDPETAARYVEEGYLWNTGIFVWTASRFLQEVHRHAPEIGAHLPHLERGDPEAFFDAVPKLSVDVAVMERSRRVAVVRATFRWDDVGAWHALFRTRSRDEDGNVVLGEGHVVDGRGNVVFSDGGPVVVFGVDDLVAVRARGVTLVTSRARAADLKALLDRLPPSVKETR